ncbi:MAG TPA: RsmB/NOP family class I SAM-dependent RNA methyltransferase [Candidatus Desulfaltia sp.]|nr:RsmB/NOP family class I SAM-dependent RNA methyltransferase [Candidatus Desulfaltia sp.]
MTESWTLAIEALSWVELKRLNEEAAYRKAVKQLGVTDREKGREAYRLVREVTRRKNALDYLVGQSIEPRGLSDLSLGARSLLRLYAYLVHYSGCPYSYANSLLELGARLISRREFRSIQDSFDLIPASTIPFPHLAERDQLALKLFFPSWYVGYLTDTFGGVYAEKLMAHVDVPSYIRVNSLVGGEETVESLQRQGYQLQGVPGLRYGYRLLEGEGLTSTREYRRGELILQDLASILAVEAAAPRPGDTVLDVCAAPGVKTSHMAQLMSNQGRIISVDNSLRRLRSWERLTETLGVSIAKPVLADASSGRGLPGFEVDVAVVDPPCTGTGTFNQSPSGKWRLTPRSIDRFSRLQWRILDNVTNYVKPGGTLLYCTCSVTVEENELNVTRLLEKHPDYRLAPSAPRIGEPGLMGLREAQRLVPVEHLCTGFFLAKLTRGQ